MTGCGDIDRSGNKLELENAEIGLVKNLKHRYFVDGERESLKELYYLATHIEGKKGLLRSIHTTQANGVWCTFILAFTRAKSASSTTQYVKEAGTGNTGWVAK